MKFNSNYIKSITIGATLLASATASATLVTHNNYTLDTSTNVVSTNGIEWLQWTATQGMSISGALGVYATDGWQLASNQHMATLYDDFNLNNGTDENSAYFTQNEYTPDDSHSIDKLLDLFGVTNIGSAYGPTIGTGPDAYAAAQALYGADADADGLYNVAFVRSDFTNRGIPEVYATVLPSDGWDSEWGGNGISVALVRPATVAEPALIMIFALGIMGLGLRRRNNVRIFRCSI